MTVKLEQLWMKLGSYISIQLLRNIITQESWSLSIGYCTFPSKSRRIDAPIESKISNHISEGSIHRISRYPSHFTYVMTIHITSIGSTHLRWSGGVSVLENLIVGEVTLYAIKNYERQLRRNVLHKDEEPMCNWLHTLAYSTFNSEFG